jgi:hypothetical protein
MCYTPLRKMLRESHTTSRLTHFRRFLHANPVTAWSVILCLTLTTSLRAQERVRTSAEPLLIETFRRSPEAFFYLGPFQEVLTGSAGVQYTDNVNLSATDKISDLSYFQALSLHTTWVLSHINQLEFTFGGQITEHFYGNGRNQVNFAIDPNSRLEFKFAVGTDVLVRLYDQFSYTQNPTTDPTATNTTNLNSLTNTIGAVVDKDLSIAVLSLAGDYTYNDESGTNIQGRNNPATTGTRQSFRVGPSLTFRLSPTILYGINAAATRSSSQHAANVNSLNFGPFINGKLSRDLEFDLAAGASLLDTKPSIPPDYYFSVALRYQITRHWQLLFSGSHDLIFTAGTSLTEENLFRVGTQFELTRAITFTAFPFVNYGEVKTNNQGAGLNQGQGSYTQFGIETSLAWRPRKRWSTALTYDFIRRESGTTAGTNASSGSYIQNTIGLQVSYLF